MVRERGSAGFLRRKLQYGPQRLRRTSTVRGQTPTAAQDQSTQPRLHMGPGELPGARVQQVPLLLAQRQQPVVWIPDDGFPKVGTHGPQLGKLAGRRGRSCAFNSLGIYRVDSSFPPLRIPPVPGFPKVVTVSEQLQSCRDGRGPGFASWTRGSRGTRSSRNESWQSAGNAANARNSGD